MTVNLENNYNLRNLKRILWAIILMGTLVAATFLIMGWQSQSWQMTVMGEAAISAVIAATVSFVLIRRGRVQAAAWLIVIAVLLILTIGPFLLKGTGLLLGIAAVILGASIAGQIFPERQVERVIFASIGIAALNILVDLFGSTARLQAPNIVIVVLSVFLGFATLFFGYNFIRQFKNYSLRIKLIVGLISVAVLSTAAVSLAINRIAENEMESLVYASVNSQARATSVTIGNEMSKQVELLKTLALNDALVNAVKDANAKYPDDPAKVKEDIAQRDQQWRAADVAKNNNDPLVQAALSSPAAKGLIFFRVVFADYAEVVITDKYGALVAATNRTTDYNQADKDWWQAANRGTNYISTLDSISYGVIIAVPILNENGNVVGILRATYRVSGMMKRLANVRTGETSNISLLFPDGNLLDAGGAVKLLDADTNANVLKSAGQYEQFLFNGKLRIVSQASLDSNSNEKNTIRALNWKVVIDQDPIEVSHPLDVISQTSLLIGLITLLVVSALAAFAGQFLASPILRLTKITEQVRAGDLNARARVENRDEIGNLAETFNNMTEQLQETLQGLEQRVAERTTEMEMRSLELADRTVALELANIRTQKRAGQLQAISDVSRAIATVRNVTDILPKITEVVSERFGFYHVGIFLLDETNQYALLSAANSEGGQRMLERGHRLKIGAQGIVGYVTETGNPRIALDTGKDAVFFNNPDLPGTHSEMAVPLKASGKIIGALDVQSEQANAFTQEDADIIQILADQVSVAIENARLFDATQKSLSESETIYRQYVRREWTRLAANEKLLGFRHTMLGTAPLERLLETKNIKQATETGETLIETSDENDQAALSVPIKLRDEVIGMLNIRAPRKRGWSQDEISLVQAVAERVAVSAENARLFDETTQRAERERTVSEITSKIRGTNDPKEMIQIAINELKQALKVKDARIVPYNPPAPKDD